jgi:hypothetical protein
MKYVLVFLELVIHQTNKTDEWCTVTDGKVIPGKNGLNLVEEIPILSANINVYLIKNGKYGG